MTKLSNLLATAALGATLTATACASHDYYGYRQGPPPPPRYEGPAGYAPGPGYVWVAGFYDLRGPRWVWVPGYWVRPPRPRAIWVAPRWERHGHEYRYHRGYWR